MKKEKFKGRRILVRVDGTKNLGLGHIYNMLTILNHFRNDKILIVMDHKKRLGNYKFKEKQYLLAYVKSKRDFQNKIKNFKPDIIFNDILDTKCSYMKSLSKSNSFIVNFEDVGFGAKEANLVFNPIYFHKKNKAKKQFFGPNYACIRDEFRLQFSNRPHVKKNQILITFGGSDPKNLTNRLLVILNGMKLRFKIIVILGMAFSHVNQTQNLVEKMKKNGHKIKIIKNSNLMAKNINKSDFVITTNGRTVFEIASLNIPFISISANPREEEHKFSSNSDGGLYLGLYSDISNQKIKNAIAKMIDLKFRKKCVKNLKKYDLINGVNTVVKKINYEYEKWQKSNR